MFVISQWLGPENNILRAFFILEVVVIDQVYMKKALDLSLLGVGFTSPNPLVGAVIVKDERIIGEGYHQHYGGSHAEVNALKNATEKVEGATMYVTLEPCAHYGKTPPCANLLAENKLKKVVIATLDPNPLVAGKGVEILRNKGIEVVVGVLEEEALKTNEIFIKYITTKRPFCILKTAMTLDGKIATHTGDSKWITNEKSRAYVHELRNKVTGIMVGVDTVIQDDPSLTTRLPNKAGSDPIRIVVDSTLRLPLTAKLLKINSDKRTIIATTDRADGGKLKELEKYKNVQVVVMPAKDSRVDLPYLMQWLGKQNIDSLLVEGGATLNFSMIEEGLIDKLISFVAPKLLGGDQAKTPIGGRGIANITDAIHLRDFKVSTFDEDIMIESYVRKEK